MLFPSAPLPPIPADTVRAAEAAFGKGNLYLTIGDQAGRLFADAGLADLDRSGEKSVALLARLAMATIFQALEGLPDRQASEAIRSRTDWKYALHLPLVYPGVAPRMLCDFRQHLLFDAAGQQVLQRLLDRLATAGLLDSRDKQCTDVAFVLIAVCTRSRLEEMAGAMRLALESLATHCPEWLRANALPHWYKRYDHTSTLLRQPHSKGEWDELARDVGSDAQYLLETISGTHAAGLDVLPEIQALRKEWHRQYEPCNGEIGWRSPHCADCNGVVRSFEGNR